MYQYASKPQYKAFTVKYTSMAAAYQCTQLFCKKWQKVLKAIKENYSLSNQIIMVGSSDVLNTKRKSDLLQHFILKQGKGV